MSLDISLYTNNNEEVASLNWLRNPFGLERWAAANVKGVPFHSNGITEPDLYEICNKWTYDESPFITRICMRATLPLTCPRIGSLYNRTCSTSS